MLAVAVLNTVLSAGYYLRLIKLAVLDDPEPTNAAIPHASPRWQSAAHGVLIVCLVLMLVVGLAWPPVLELVAPAAASVCLAR
jgi:NADH:ubiquinone oxidoreductase subunit 2 (subunit N)